MARRNVFARRVAQVDQGVGQFDARFLGHLLGFVDLSGLTTPWRIRISVKSAFFLAIGDSGLAEGGVCGKGVYPLLSISPQKT